MRPTLALVGAGKVGGVLARLLVVRGYAITMIYSRTFAHAEALAQVIGGLAVKTLSEIDADLVLLTVPDDAITATAAGLAGFTGKAVIHTSGAHDARSLAMLAERGVQVGSLHPAYPFADVATAIDGLPRSTFAVEAQDEPLRSWLFEIVATLDGQVLVIPPGGKATYHAALAIASNYTVTLYALAESLLSGLGADKAVADAALNPLLVGTVANLQTQGVPDALTGPLVRGDAGTIAAHLAALSAVDGAVDDLYRQLARLTLPLVRARGVATEEIERVLDSPSPAP